MQKANQPGLMESINIDDPMRECTFTPKVKGVRNNMPSAKLYVNTNVVDRLTRPVTTAPPPPDDTMRAFDGDSAVLDVASFMGTLAAGATRGFSTPGRGRPNSAPRERPKLPVSPEEKAKRTQAFKEFLSRQAQVSIKKETKVKEVVKELTHSFTPKLCRKSLGMADSSYTGEFLTRVDRDVSRRTDTAQKLKTYVEPECTWKPKINQRSGSMNSRSVAEMSRGDMLRKAANYRMMKIKAEQERMVDHTFEPQISKRAQSAGRGKLQLNAEGSSFLNSYTEGLRTKEDEKLRRENEIEESELLACTFAPETRDCPAYVKRIAQSMAIVRAARSDDSVAKSPEKPDWK
jgi:hypothetical protein